MRSEDARRTRSICSNRFYGALEQAERTDDPAARSEWLTFVVVGGGPTGVEIAGELAITAQRP